MRAHKNPALASYIDWWSDAGLTDPVQDDPCLWVQPPAPANDVPAPLTPTTINHGKTAPEWSKKPAPPAVAPTDLPADLASFDVWLRDHPTVPGAEWSPRRICPIGPECAPIMVLSDMPDPADIAAGHLLSGDVGALFDAMLAAIGRTRTELRLGSIALTRPAGGRWDDEGAALLRDIALHHIKIARPAHLLLLGQMTCRLMTGKDVPADGDGLRNINHYGVTTAATAIHHPRLLLTRQALKRGAWTALKMLREPV
jgi:DNA polymerase